MAESEEELKNFSVRVKEENEKACLKLNIKKRKQTTKKKPDIMKFSSITSRQIEEEKVEAVEDFLFLGSKFTADGDCRREIRRLLFSSKAVTNLDNVSKSRDITLPTKVHIVKATLCGTSDKESTCQCRRHKRRGFSP